MPYGAHDTIRVLLVDDEATQGELTAINLRHYAPNLTVTAVSSPSDALNLLDAQPFDCVVSDYQMPKMNGICLCAEVKRLMGIPCILYTGRGSEEVASDAYSAGLDDYIRKEKEISHFQVLAKRIRAAVEKKRVDELYRASVEGARDGLCIIQDVNVVYANKAMAGMLGLKDPRELIGSSIMRWVVEMERDLVRDRTLNRQRGGEEPKVYEHGIRRADGEIRTLEAFVSLINYMGRPASLVFNHDVTERKRAEETLRRSESLLRQSNELLEAVTREAEVIIATQDASLRYTYFNEAYRDEVERLSGKRIEIGSSMVDTVAHMPEQQKIALDEWSRVLRGESVDSIVEFGDPAGYRRTYRSLKTPLRDASGKIIGAGEIAYDVTERRKTENALRESEERFRKAFQVSPAAMAISTVDEGKFIDVNESFLLISGYSREELIGNRSVDVGVIGPDERAKIMEFIRRQGYVRNHEFPAVTKTGRRLTVLSSTDVINMGGRDHLLSTIIDITDRDEETLRESK